MPLQVMQVAPVGVLTKASIYQILIYNLLAGLIIFNIRKHPGKGVSGKLVIEVLHRVFIPGTGEESQWRYIFFTSIKVASSFEDALASCKVAPAGVLT